MAASLIVLVVLRMFSLLWLIQGLSELAPAADQFSITHDGLILLPSLVILIFAIISWIIAPTLSRRILGGHDTSVAISGLTRLDLYCFAFVFLGLYFMLSSVGNALNWLHYYFLDAAQTSLSYSQRQSPNYYGLSQALVTLVAGALCLFKGKSWAGKLISAGK